MSIEIDKKAETHRKVIDVAAAAIREFGPGGIGVADLMKKAGLTHGGFYAHFESKDDLIAQAISQMFEDSNRRFLKHLQHGGPQDALIRFIDGYLSERHRDTPARGCPLPSLSGDVARLPAAARDRFAAGIDRLTTAVADLFAQLGRPAPMQLAASVLAEMVGAVALSRVVPDPEYSASILRTSRNALMSRLGLEADDAVTAFSLQTPAF